MDNKSTAQALIEKHGWDLLSHYFETDICEAVHNELAPCTNESFLERYLELDPEFAIN